MPELPEVETTIQHLRPLLLDKLIKQVDVAPRGERHFNLPVADVRAALEGATLRDLQRIGKWMLFDFDKTKAIGHLRMSGRYVAATDASDSKHRGFSLALADNSRVDYVDQRRFGTFHLVSEFTDYPTLALLGPDALSTQFSSEYLQEKLQKVKKNIYSALLDQTIVAGLGNIYVNESLNAASIHPLTPASALSAEQIDLLVNEIKRILNLALTLKGTTLSDNLYQDPEGKQGKFYQLLQVYGKHKHPNIEVLKIGSRSVFVNKATPKPTGLN